MKAKNITKKNNTYYSDFIDPQGERVRKSLGKDLAQAKIKVLQLIANINIQDESTESATKSSTPKTFLSALNEYMYSVYKVQDALKRPSWDQWTERQAQDVMSTLMGLQKHAGVAKVNAFRFKHFDSFLRDRAQEVRNRTINKYVQRIKRFFSYCEDYEWITQNPARRLKTLKADTPFRYHFKQDEIETVLANAGDFKRFFVMALATGLRACDLWELSPSDFEVIEDTMYLKIWEKKTKAFLYIPIAPEAQEIVEAADGRLFPNADQQMWRDTLLRNLQSNFSRSYCRKWNIRLHTLRHTFAMRAGAAGMSKEALQQFLGHASVKTTEVYFNQLPKEVLKDQIKVVPKLI